MTTIWQDLRYGLRLFISNPGFTAVAVLTLAFGIAANTTVFSWVDGLLLHPYPDAAHGERLAIMESTIDGAPNGANQVSYPDVRDYRQHLKSIDGLAIYREEVLSLGDGKASSQAVWGQFVSGNFFDVLEVQPQLGRTFSVAESGDELGTHAVAVISDALWRGRFRGDPNVIGRTLRVNQRELTVIGVAPRRFHGTMPGLAFELWIPVTMGPALSVLDPEDFGRRGRRPFYAMVRLKEGTSLEQASAEVTAYSQNLGVAYPASNRTVRAHVAPLWEFHSAAPELLMRPLRILMGISLLVLLIVCANVANLLLARAVSRRKELNIRLALGASGRRLSRQLMTETFLLAGAGALSGWLLSYWLSDLLPGLVPKINAPVAIGFNTSPRVLGFTIAACLMATLLAGSVPALMWFRTNLQESLNEGGRAGTPGLHSNATRGLLVVMEVALATVALIGAGLFLRSFQNARSLDAGFQRDRVLLSRFYLSGAGMTPPERREFFRQLSDRVRSLPGVAEVSYGNDAPLGSSAGPYTTVEPEGYAKAPGEFTIVNNYVVAPGFFDAMQIPLLQGRDFRQSDDEKTEPVAIVNETFARKYFQTDHPVGRRMKFYGKWATVIGMARDSKYFNIAEAPRPHFFASMQQYTMPGQQFYFFIRSSSDPASMSRSLRREVLALNPAAGAFDSMPLREWTEVTLLPQKVAANLLTALALTGLLLAGVGLYSVIAYSVSQRVQEIGIRMALGASPGLVLGQVLGRGLLLTGSGLVLGLAVSMMLSRLVSGMLIHVDALDPLTFSGSALFLLSVAVVAAWVPARRATHIDPISALRCE